MGAGHGQHFDFRLANAGNPAHPLRRWREHGDCGACLALFSRAAPPALNATMISVFCLSR
jgi:hypothetical protein